MTEIKQEILNQLLTHGGQMQDEIKALKRMLKLLQWVYGSHHLCAICGAFAQHQPTCMLAALIYDDRAKMFLEMFGVSVKDIMLSETLNVIDEGM